MFYKLLASYETTSHMQGQGRRAGRNVLQQGISWQPELCLCVVKNVLLKQNTKELEFKRL